jgi:3-oxoacyl-[acyl-carrier-protein] synthase-3
MPKAIFNQAKISGIVTVVPSNFRLIDDEVDTLYNGDIKQIERIKKSIGLNKRHILKGNSTTADLCELAANKLLDGMQIDRSTIDAIITVTQTPDYFQPSTSAYLHGRLDLGQNCATFDVNQGCSGYVYGLWLGFMMLQTNSCENVLLLAGDTLSKVVNQADSNVATLFGDGASATLIQKSPMGTNSYFTIHSNGKKFDTIIQPKGAFRVPSKREINDDRILDEVSDKRTLENLYMDGAEVFNFSIMTEPVAIKEILEISNSTEEEIDYIVFHQANKYIISNIARRLKFPLEKAPSETTGKYGNQSSASIPCTICDALREEVSSKKLNVVLSGFGVGLSWATCKLELDKIYCSEVIFYDEEE